MKVREGEKRLVSEGWVLARTSGHKIYRHAEKQGLVVVPNHPNDEIANGTLESIKKAAGWQ